MQSLLLMEKLLKYLWKSLRIYANRAYSGSQSRFRILEKFRQIGYITKDIKAA